MESDQRPIDGYSTVWRKRPRAGAVGPAAERLRALPSTHYLVRPVRRVHGELTGTDTIMNQTLFIGVYPGLSQEMLEYVADRIALFFKTKI